MQEVRRNLFEAYRPRRTLLKLISTTNSSAAAFPGGEAFDFTFSPNGHCTLALCSSRVYVLDTISAVVSVQRELKVLRRPVSAAILDDGSILTVLSNVHQVNIYDLSNAKVKHLRAIALDNPSNTIALSRKGEVLAAAYEGGIEVHSLAGGALVTDRRAVKCDSVDSLAFSSDGTMLLGTTQNSKYPNTVILSAPYYSEADHGLPPTDLLCQMWTSQILFPNSSRDCSHAALLAHHSEGDASWTFTYDRVFESFRAVRTDDLRNGTTYFTGPQTSGSSGSRSARGKLIPCTLPSASDRGELVAAGFLGREVWLYGVPQNLDTSIASQSDDQRAQGFAASGSSVTSTIGGDPRNPARSLTSSEAAELMRLPQWQVLVDKYRNVFTKGRRVAELSGVSSVRWVSPVHDSSKLPSISRRLIITAPGGVSGPSELEQDEFAIVDSGRLLILDFDRTIEDGKYEEIIFDVGNIAPELLEEENIDMDTEVALVRQRTVRQRKGVPVRSNVVNLLASIPDLPTHHPPTLALQPSNISASTDTSSATVETPQERSGALGSPQIEGLNLEEASAVFDGPYSHTQPRSRTSLYRSATAVAANRQRNPPRITPQPPAEIRRADGRGELPHESDADNWVPPPPPYTPDPDTSLPEHLRLSLLPRASETSPEEPIEPDLRRRATTMTRIMLQSSTSRRISSLPDRFNFSRRREAPGNSSQILETDGPPLVPLHTSEVTRTMSSFGPSNGPPLDADSRASSVSPQRRPASAYVDSSHTSIQRRPVANRLIIPTTSIPPMPPIAEPLAPPRHIFGQSQSLSLPSSPIHHDSSPLASNLTLSGSNLQQRLDYPLPPAPSRATTTPSPTPLAESTLSTSSSAAARVSGINMIAACMPSAQQVAHLQNRYSHPPTPLSGSPVCHSPSASFSSAPPRGALGAASSLNPAINHRRLSISYRNPLAATSSPALLRPSPRRLETIQSVSEMMEEGGGGGLQARARSMDVVSGNDDLGMTGDRRSRSLGPLVEMGREREVKKSWWRRKWGEGREWDMFRQSEEDKGGKCVMM